jgi:PAS domain S-box-containing protein
MTLKGKIEFWEFRAVNKDSSVKFVRTSSSLIKMNGEIVGLTVLMSDITSKKRIEEDLRTHQIELEMQNEELRWKQEELETLRAKYFDLYDLAPVGYLTISEEGLILEANLYAASLLGVDRSAMVKQPISSYIFKDDQDIYYLHRKKLIETGEPQTCELRIIKKNETIFKAYLQFTAAQNDNGEPACRVVVVKRSAS